MTAKEQHKAEMWQAWEKGSSLWAGVQRKLFDQWYEENFSDPESLKTAEKAGYKSGYDLGFEAGNDEGYMKGFDDGKS